MASFEVAGGDLAVVVFSDRQTDLVGRIIKPAFLLLGGLVEDVDEAPGEVFGGALHRRIGKEAEEVAPAGADGLGNRIAVGNLAVAGFGIANVQLVEAERYELGGKAGLHRRSP